MVRSQLWTFGMQDATDQGTMMRSGEIFLCHDGRETWLMPALAIRLRGQHNQQNVLAACAIGAAAGFPPEALWRGVEGFTGVAHRLEFVRSWGGASWYNDSIATAPERTMAAIRSFDEPLVVLAGGRDKDLPWQEFAQLARSRLDHLILFGEAAAVIGRAIGSDFPYISCQNLEEAVQAAARIVKPGDVVLLSPGGTSYDEFRDFEERGECFKRLVMNL
jgi:UDP-N-acetylmuramoylalanine--D-glutamate ligase